VRGVWLASALAAALSVSGVEQGYLDLRDAEDRVRIAEARGLRDLDGVPLATLREQVGERRRALEQDLSSLSTRALGDGDRRALEEIRRHVDEASSEPEAKAPSCSDVTADESFERLSARLYACFGEANDAIAFDGEKLDRLSVLERLAREPGAGRRKALFLAMEPLYRAVNGDDAAASPYRRLIRLSAARWRAAGSPVAKSLQALGVAEGELEPWLVAVLEAWRRATPPDPIEPWDLAYATSSADRALVARIPLARLREINDRYYASLGADVGALGIHYDLAPREGKTPVAFTDFGARPRLRSDGTWATGEPWVFATYRAGGLGNLVELLHETGHAVHIAAIRTRPAFADWPDSDTFTEALADLAALEAYEPEWQRRYVGAEASLAASLQSKYAGIVLDVAWAVFELRLHHDPEADPNRVWTDLTERYLHVVPHPEISWWARRGQLVESPGYMVNYALGAILVADMRARCRALRGPLWDADHRYYAWLSEHLYHYGLERTSGDVLTGFLGRGPSPDALVSDLGRALPSR
jgi:hypothetical protein